MGYINGKKVLQVVKTEYVTTVDDALSTTSENPVQNKVVTQALNGKVDTVAGKGLSTNDFTDALKSKVEEVDNKANTSDLENGNITVEKSKLAKQIEPVSEESGTYQDDPFIIQGTGTANNTDSVDTSPIAKQIEKQGNTIVYNQQLKNGDFASVSDWSTNNASYTVSNNVATITLSAQNGYIRQSYPKINGHKVLVSLELKGVNGITYTFNGEVPNTVANGNWQTLTQINTRNSNGTDYLVISSNETSDFQAFQVKNAYVVDLTQWFNGNIPQDLLDNPSHFSWYYQGALTYNTGELVNCNGRYLENLYRQQWDEIVKQNYYYNNAGTLVSTSNYDCSQNKFRVIPNATYFASKGSGSTYSGTGIYLIYFDNAGNCINTNNEQYLVYFGNQFTVPANAYSMAFNGSYQNHFGNNPEFTISLYYTTGDSYDQYFAYEEPTVYDTGSETLYFLDKKEPSGLITHNSAKYTFTGSESWIAYGSGYRAEVLTGKEYKTISGPVVPTNVLNDTGLTLTDRDSISSGGSGISVNGANIIVSSTSGLTGKSIEYELATSTTEQGTPFAENIEIDDYGTMAWYSAYTDENTNTPVTIPQGVKIFYPADYVNYVDSLHKITDGDPLKVFAKNNDYVLVAQPTSVDTYAGGLISVDNINDYSLFLVYFDSNCSDRPKSTGIIMNVSGVPQELIQNFTFTSDNNLYGVVASRRVTVGSTGLTFDAGYVHQSSEGTTINANSLIIPLAIYGVKLK